MAWFIMRQTSAEYQPVYISGVPGMEEEEVEQELQNLARLQAIEAAARDIMPLMWENGMEGESNFEIAVINLKRALERK